MYIKQYQLILITLIAAIAMLLAAWTAHQKIHDSIEESVGESLTTVLNTAHKAVQSWAQREQAIVEIWSDNLNIRQAAASLLAGKLDRESLIANPAQQKLRKQLMPILMVKGYRGYFIVDKNNINLASSRDVNIGEFNLLVKEDGFFDRIWAGYSAVSRPVTSDVILPEMISDKRVLNQSIFAGAPILNDDYEVVAAFLFRIDPHQDFTNILQQGRMGVSGETYAFSPKGEMVSLSRFDEKIHKLDLILGGTDDKRHLIELRDPGVNMVAGAVSQTPRAEQPFTRMVRSALQKRAGTDLDGYRDYRGVMVLGSWLWDDDLQMGFATEMDYEEATQTVRFTGYVITIFSVVILLLLIILMLAFDRGRRQAARQSRELRKIIDGSPVAMVLTDNFGNIDFFNRHFIELFGWTTKDVRTPEEWWQAAYPNPEYRQQVQREWEQAASEAQGLPIAPQYWSLNCKNGTTRDVEFRMVPVSDTVSVIALVDLTERNRALRTISYERDRAQSYLDTVDVMILALDPSGIITQINRAGCEVLGYDEEALIGLNWFEVFIPEGERQRLKDAVYMPSVKGDEHTESYLENEIVIRSGEQRLIAWHNAQLKDDRGMAVGVLSAGTDITDIRRAENEHQRLQSQLLKTQKAEAIGQLSAGVSHNFNNMFGSIIGFLGLAKRKAAASDDADMQRYLEEALVSSYRARDLVKQIANFSRKSSVDIRPHALGDVLPQSMELLNNIIPSAVEIKVDISEDLPPVYIDEEKFQQILADVISNASDAMDGQGTVEITSHHENVVENNCSSCHELYRGDYVVVNIRDSGHGMDKQTLKRIFDPFFSTCNVGQGAGMGMPVVHGIIHNMGGHIQVSSKLGEGTLVSLYLPVTHQSED